MAYANAYEKLYDTMKNRFTVIKDNSEYSLGEYMALKSANAAAKAEEAQKTNMKNTVSSFFTYLREKIEQKKAQPKVRRAFPLKSFASACLCALVVTALTLSFDAFATMASESTAPVVADENAEDEQETLKYEIND